VNRAVAVGVLLVVGLAVGGFLACFKPVRDTVDVGYEGEARVNPYLAFERLLSELGAPAETVWGDVELAEGDHTLVLLGPEPLPPNLELGDLLDWVAAGGQLVVTPAVARHADPLLGHFGLSVVDVEDDAEEEDGEMKEAGAGGKDGDEDGDADDDGLSEEQLQRLLEIYTERLERVDLELPWVAAPFRVTLPTRLRFELDPEHLADSGDGAAFTVDPILHSSEYLHLVEHGSGTVYFVLDGQFLDNDRIGRLDHARLGWALVEWEDDAGVHRGGVTIAIRESPPSLLGLLWTHAWPLAVSGVVLLAALLVAASARLGPVRRPPPEERRRLLEHVEASGVFLWHQGRGGDLLAGARGALMVHLERREPAWAKLPPRELVRQLAEHSGVAAERLASALYSPAPEGRLEPAAFTDSIATLETVRRSL
jgi:hypothetical protein